MFSFSRHFISYYITIHTYIYIRAYVFVFVYEHALFVYKYKYICACSICDGPSVDNEQQHVAKGKRKTVSCRLRDAV